MITLRSYQSEAIEKLLASLAIGKNPVCALPAGSGKSLCIAELCNRLDGRILVVTHRKELIQQNESILLRMGSDSVGAYSAGLGRREMDTRVVFAGVASIYRRMRELQASGPFRYVLWDECFPAGTLVDGVPIEDVRIGDYVSTYNHDSVQIEMKKVSASSVRQSNILMTITLENDIIIKCTPNHPFFTEAGYVPAKDLEAEDRLFIRASDVSLVQERDNRDVECPKNQDEEQRESILLERMRVRFPKGIYEHTPEDTQPNVQPRDEGKDVCDVKEDWSQAKDTGREWQGIIEATGDDVNPSGAGVGSRICRDDGNPSRGEIAWASLVSDRPSIPGIQDSSRDRRGESSSDKSEGEGQAQGYNSGGLRMVRITSIEQADIKRPGGVLVYNLEVEGNHNYFANNILVHNCHTGITGRDGTSMADQVLQACPTAQRVGFSATPYRLPDTPIWGDSASWFDEIGYEASILDLTKQGYLCRLVGVQTASAPDLSHVRTRGGDFALGDLSQASSEEDVVNSACDEILYLAQDRKHILIFCVDVMHAGIVAEALRERGCEPEVVLGTTPGDERDFILNRFKQGKIRYLVNVSVATTGWDAPNVDAVVLLRSTMSRSLLLQMVGRGSRLHPEKLNALILDCGGNLARHAPIDGLPNILRSPALAEKQEKAERERRQRVEQERKVRHDAMVARGIDPLAMDALDDDDVTVIVTDVVYKLIPAKRYPGRQNLLVSYKGMTTEGQHRTVTQFVLLDYPGRPGAEASAWFARRGMEKPAHPRQALAMAWNAPVPSEIVVRKNAGWDEVTMEHFEE